MRIESWLREQGEWINEPVLLLTLDDRLTIPVLGASLPLTDLYDGVRPSALDDA